jgi:hypothetical protein
MLAHWDKVLGDDAVEAAHGKQTMDDFEFNMMR